MSDHLDMPEDNVALAGEYVLGTLPADERRHAEDLLARNPEFAASVALWQERLSMLDDAIAPVEPPASAWEAIRRRILAVSDEAANVVDLTRRLSFWRRTAIASTAAAACMAAGLATLAVFTPLQDILQPQQAPEHYVAVINRGGDLPALIVTVDQATQYVSVRTVAAEQPADRSLEVWAIAEGAPAPVSLGLVDPESERTDLLRRSDVDLTGGPVTIAISQEPLGGSTTGLPTGPVVYSGQLIRTD